MSSRHRLYLNLKRSITSLFKTPAHYLKEITGRQSLFEKPYLDKDYRAMHLQLPTPNWKRPEGERGLWPKPGGIWPRGRVHRFVFDDGECSLFSHGGACGEVIGISGLVSMVPMGDLDTVISWHVNYSDDSLAQIIGTKLNLNTKEIDILVQLSDINTGTVTICASATMTKGSVLKEIAYQVPAFLGRIRVCPGWAPNFGYASRKLPPIYETRQSPSWDCGCVDINVTCECSNPGVTWGAGSDETVEQDDSALVELDNPGNCEYTWSIIGSGFTLASETGKSNIVNADDAACGSATITVTSEKGDVITGFVRSTTGSWGEAETTCSTSEGSGSSYCELIKGNKKYTANCQCIGTSNCAACTPVCTYTSGGCTGAGFCGGDGGCSPCYYPDDPRCQFGTVWTKEALWGC